MPPFRPRKELRTGQQTGFRKGQVWTVGEGGVGDDAVPVHSLLGCWMQDTVLLRQAVHQRLLEHGGKDRGHLVGPAGDERSRTQLFLLSAIPSL